ncbi:NAD(P)H-dependent oxidoreductase [Microvirga sp. VF16]|uniref:NAD(P)H-dependent oxidoreductase n=1 Tax=Microvirga sp. VF16 TaxID=2807101 RepID=UPI00193E6448|nr:NAD(P)H-dependent oxidoreductase [Microvirga sp. VF16]QRM29241.1 NAD(P)H-dependent oxidoreductase [Microvirga sp. VF16]
MKVLLVHAHPEPASFCTAMKDAAVDTLRRAGHEVTVSDLYEQRFNPVAGPDDFGSRRNPDYLVYSLEQRNGWQNGTIATDIACEAERVLESDLLILNFPIFWFSVPAIMKGWIDRVFLSGAFFGGKRIYDRAELTGKKALVTATLGGREHMFGTQAVHGEITGMLRHLLQGTLGYCGFQVLQPFFAFHVPYLSDAERQKWLDDYRNYLGEIETLPRLPMPSLDDYDDILRPLTQKPQPSLP